MRPFVGRDEGTLERQQVWIGEHFEAERIHHSVYGRPAEEETEQRLFETAWHRRPAVRQLALHGSERGAERFVAPGCGFPSRVVRRAVRAVQTGHDILTKPY